MVEYLYCSSHVGGPGVIGSNVLNATGTPTHWINVEEKAGSRILCGLYLI